MFDPASSPAQVKPLILGAAILFAAYQFLPQRSAVTGPVATAMRSAPSTDRQRVASIYASLADLIERDGGSTIATTAIWRAIYSDALRLAAGGTDLPGKYPGLDAAIEQVLAEHYSLDNLPIDKALAAKIAAGCRAVEAQVE
jgi:hypothetical protein